MYFCKVICKKTKFIISFKRPDKFSKDQIRTVIRTFKEKVLTDIFPGRKHVPKTLIYAKDDNHAEEIVQIIREEFDEGNDFAVKITYKTEGEKPENLIRQFRNELDDLQEILRIYTQMLAEMAGVEDLTELED